MSDAADEHLPTGRQLEALRAIGRQRGEPVAELVREAVEGWLTTQGSRVIDETDWGERFRALLERRRAVADDRREAERTVERDVARAMTEARRTRPSHRR